MASNITYQTMVTKYADSYNVRDYGLLGNGSTDDYGKFNTLLTSIGSSTKSDVYFPAGTYKLSTSITIPSNIRLIFANGAMLSPDSTKVVTINGEIEAGLYQIFTGSGSISGTPINKEIPVEWFGCNTGTNFDNATLIQLAINFCSSSGKKLRLGTGNYSLYSGITIPDGTTSGFGIIGITGSTLQLRVSNATLLTTLEWRNGLLKDITLYTTGTTNTIGIKLGNLSTTKPVVSLTIDKITVTGFTTGVIHDYGWTSSIYTLICNNATNIGMQINYGNALLFDRFYSGGCGVGVEINESGGILFNLLELESYTTSGITINKGKVTIIEPYFESSTAGSYMLKAGTGANTVDTLTIINGSYSYQTNIIFDKVNTLNLSGTFATLTKRNNVQFTENVGNCNIPYNRQINFTKDTTCGATSIISPSRKYGLKPLFSANLSNALISGNTAKIDPSLLGNVTFSGQSSQSASNYTLTQVPSGLSIAPATGQTNFRYFVKFNDKNMFKVGQKYTAVINHQQSEFNNNTFVGYVKLYYKDGSNVDKTATLSTPDFLITTTNIDIASKDIYVILPIWLDNMPGDYTTFTRIEIAVYLNGSTATDGTETMYIKSLDLYDTDNLDIPYFNKSIFNKFYDMETSIINLKDKTTGANVPVYMDNGVLYVGTKTVTLNG